MNRIKELRKQKNLSLNQLSSELKKAGKYLSADSLSKYERGVRNPKIENLEKLAMYYEVTVDYLRGKSNKKHGASVVDTATSDAALPDNLPVIPKAVSEYIQWGKSYDIQLYMMYNFKFIHSQGFKKLTDDVESWIISSSDTFARAWLDSYEVEVNEP